MLKYNEKTYQNHFVIDHILDNISLYEVYDVLFSPESKYLHSVFEIFNVIDLKYEVIENPIKDNTYPSYLIKCNFILPTAPERKVFLGPSKLDVYIEYKIFFETEKKFYVETITNIKGYMLVDSFISHALLKFEQNENDVILNIKYDLEFIKKNPFKDMYYKRGVNENKEDYINVYVPQMDKFISLYKNDNKEKEQKNELKE